MKIIKIKKTPSTNDYIKKYIPSNTDVVVIAEEQTKGKGTKGRAFSSLKGGLYLSYYRIGRGEQAKDCFKIMMDVCMAVVKTLRAFGVNAYVKWPNDVYVDGKKICGILTENFFAQNYISHSIIGVGINVENNLPEELKDIAVSLKDVTTGVDLQTFTATLLFNLTQESSVEEYTSSSLTIGKTVKVYAGEKVFFDTCVDVLQTGEILLKEAGKICSAEVKVVDLLTKEEEKSLDKEFFAVVEKFFKDEKLEKLDVLSILQNSPMANIVYLDEGCACIGDLQQKTLYFYCTGEQECKRAFLYQCEKYQKCVCLNESSLKTAEKYISLLQLKLSLTMA